MENKHFFRKVVPSGQGFDGDYCGLFRFRFYRHGDWFEVQKSPFHFRTNIWVSLIFVHDDGLSESGFRHVGFSQLLR